MMDPRSGRVRGGGRLVLGFSRRAAAILMATAMPSLCGRMTMIVAAPGKRAQFVRRRHERAEDSYPIRYEVHLRFCRKGGLSCTLDDNSG